MWERGVGKKKIADEGNGKKKTAEGHIKGHEHGLDFGRAPMP